MAQILFAAIFTFARMVVGPCLTYVTLSANYPLLIKVLFVAFLQRNHFYFLKYFWVTTQLCLILSIVSLQAMGLGLQLVSAFWFFKIVRMMKHKLTKRTTSKYGVNHANITRKTTNSKLQQSQQSSRMRETQDIRILQSVKCMLATAS